MQTEELIAGPTMNARVAEKVMRWHREGNTWVADDGKAQRDVEWISHDDEPWSPSTDISAAFEIVEHERARWSNNLRVTIQSAVDGWSCDLIALTGHGRQGYGVGETAPLAICRAALAAVKG